jgi:hypothetical protein
VKIPKALLPNWRAHPDMDSIGLDIMTADADAPGVDCLHPAVKGARYLLDVANHFQSPEKLSVAKFEKTPATMPSASTTTTTQASTTQSSTTQVASVPMPTTAVLSAPSTASAPMTTTASADPRVERVRAAKLETADAIAQEILDAATGEGAAILADTALASPHLVIRKAGAFVLAQRPALDAPISALASIVQASMATTQPDDLEIRKYALMALARRYKLAADGLFDAYAKAGNDPTLRLTYIWCAGINGDKTIGPKLIPLLGDPNLRIRMMTALSLGTLKEASAVEALKAMASKDPHQYGQTQAKLALEQIAGGQ